MQVDRLRVVRLVRRTCADDSGNEAGERAERDLPKHSAKLRWRARPALGDHLGVKTRTVNVSFNIGGRGRLPSPDGTGVGPYEAVTR